MTTLALAVALTGLFMVPAKRRFRRFRLRRMVLRRLRELPV